MDFSVLEETFSLLKATGQIVEGTPEDPSGVSTGTTTRITGRPDTLLRWCQAPEPAVVQRDLSDARVFAGFEAFSRARGVTDRYRRVGATAASLTVIGAPDAALDFPVTAAVSIHAGPLLREWFLLVVSESYSGLLAARDLDGLGQGRPAADRRFEGVITHHAPTIRGLAERLEGEVERALG